MHAQSSGQPVTAQRWSIPHSEYTTLQELVAAGGQASITLESSQGGDRRAIQATCHVTTTRQHPLPDVQHALRVDMQIPGQPLHQAECRAWLEELVNAIQLYANTPEPTPPATPVALPCPVCGHPARTDKLTIDGAHWITSCSNGYRIAGQPHPEYRATSKEAAIAGWNLLATSGKYSPLPQLEDIATGWEQLGIPQQPAAQAHAPGCCGQCQPDHQPLRIAITGLPRAGKTAAAQFLLRHHRAFVFDQPISEEEAARFRAADVTILHILRAHPGLRPAYADQSAIDIHDDDLVLHNNCELTGIGGLHAQLDAAVDLIRKRAHHCARQHPDSEAA